jgi:hypothetical protein
VKGSHEGPALTAVDKPVVGDWIKLWNATRPKVLDGGTGKPTVMPFAPTMGANTIDLSVLDTTLGGQKITFNASMVGSQLHLSNINVVAAPGMGVHLVHPLWVTWDATMTPTPDPVDSFSNLDETVLGGDSKTMGPGTLFLPNFATTMMVNLVFATIEPKGGSSDGGTGTLGCKNVASWTTNTKPPLMASCTSCHGGGNGTATAAFPLQAANSDTQNWARSTPRRRPTAASTPFPTRASPGTATRSTSPIRRPSRASRARSGCGSRTKNDWERGPHA